MPFDVRHKLLTLHGELWRLTAAPEEWSLGLRIQPIDTVAVTQAQANAADAVVRTWWNALPDGPQTGSNHTFTHVKLAPIAVDGNYPPGEISYESPFVRINGSSASAQIWPGQCATAVTLISAKPGGRGRASKGRVYLPPLGTSIGVDGRITNSVATNLSTGMANLIGALNDVPNLGGVAVFSQVGAGDHYPVISCRTGTVVDTIRRRRRQLPENPTAAVVVP